MADWRHPHMIQVHFLGIWFAHPASNEQALPYGPQCCSQLVWQTRKAKTSGACGRRSKMSMK